MEDMGAPAYPVPRALPVRPMRSGDVADARLLIQRSFPEEARANPRAFEELEEEPWYAPSHRLVGVEGDRVVAHLALRTGELWIAGHAFPAGMIGLLAVDPGMRGTGRGRTMLDAGCVELARRGREVAAVRAPSELSPFFLAAGFRRAAVVRPSWHTELAYANADALARAGSAAHESRHCAADSLAVSRGTPEDAAVFDALHFQHHSRLTGGWSRSVRFWERRLAGAPKPWTWPPPEFHLARRASDGVPAAYVALTRRPDRWEVVESACVAGHEPALAAMAGSFALRARSEGARYFSVDMGATDPAVGHVVNLGLRWQVITDALFVKPLDPAKVVRRAEEILALRAVSAGVDALVELAGGAGFALGNARGDLTVRTGTAELLALVYEGAELEYLHDTGAVAVAPRGPQAIARAKKLFPDTYAFRSVVDGY